jgi:hypothetical protein
MRCLASPPPPFLSLLLCSLSPATLLYRAVAWPARQRRGRWCGAAANEAAPFLSTWQRGRPVASGATRAASGTGWRGNEVTARPAGHCSVFLFCDKTITVSFRSDDDSDPIDLETGSDGSVCIVVYPAMKFIMDKDGAT